MNNLEFDPNVWRDAMNEIVIQKCNVCGKNCSDKTAVQFYKHQSNCKYSKKKKDSDRLLLKETKRKLADESFHKGDGSDLSEDEELPMPMFKKVNTGNSSNDAVIVDPPSQVPPMAIIPANNPTMVEIPVYIPANEENMRSRTLAVKFACSANLSESDKVNLQRSIEKYTIALIATSIHFGREKAYEYNFFELNKMSEVIEREREKFNMHQSKLTEDFTAKLGTIGSTFMRGLHMIDACDDDEKLIAILENYKMSLTSSDINSMIDFMQSKMSESDEMKETFKLAFNACNHEMDKTKIQLNAEQLAIIDGLDCIADASDILRYQYFLVVMQLKMQQIQSGVCNIRPYSSMKVLLNFLNNKNFQRTDSKVKIVGEVKPWYRKFF